MSIGLIVYWNNLTSKCLVFLHVLFLGGHNIHPAILDKNPGYYLCPLYCNFYSIILLKKLKKLFTFVVDEILPSLLWVSVGFCCLFYNHFKTFLSRSTVGTPSYRAMEFHHRLLKQWNVIIVLTIITMSMLIGMMTSSDLLHNFFVIVCLENYAIIDYKHHIIHPPSNVFSSSDGNWTPKFMRCKASQQLAHHWLTIFREAISTLFPTYRYADFCPVYASAISVAAW